MKHFEDIWLLGEKLFQDTVAQEQVSSILEELLLKINLYKALDEQKQIPLEEMQKVKARTFGELLLTLTNLSLKDNIDVFNALSTALNYKSIEVYLNKHSTD